jgi:hypothetical protein
VHVHALAAVVHRPEVAAAAAKGVAAAGALASGPLLLVRILKGASSGARAACRGSGGVSVRGAMSDADGEVR